MSSRMHQNAPFQRRKYQIFFWGGCTTPSPDPILVSNPLQTTFLATGLFPFLHVYVYAVVTFTFLHNERCAFGVTRNFFPNCMSIEQTRDLDLGWRIPYIRTSAVGYTLYEFTSTMFNTVYIYSIVICCWRRERGECDTIRMGDDKTPYDETPTKLNFEWHLTVESDSVMYIFNTYMHKKMS